MTATHYFFLLIAIFILLFVIALVLPKLKGKQNKNLNNNSTDNKALAKLFALCQELLSPFDYQINLSDKYITLIKNNQKIALLTLDDKLGNHTRKMGDSLIVNFNALPNKKALEQRLIQDKIIKLN